MVLKEGTVDLHGKRRKNPKPPLVYVVVSVRLACSTPYNHAVSNLNLETYILLYKDEIDLVTLCSAQNPVRANINFISCVSRV